MVIGKKHDPLLCTVFDYFNDLVMEVSDGDVQRG